MADGTVSIELELKNKGQFLSDVQQANKELAEFGSQAGDKMDSKLAENVQKSKRTLDSFPKTVTTKLEAKAEEAGIKNFSEVLKKLPKEQRVKVLSDVQDGKAVDFEKLLKDMPKDVRTKVQLTDDASPRLKNIRDSEQEIPKNKNTTVKVKDEATEPLHRVNKTADEATGHFAHLKEIVAGTFIGSAITNGIGAVTAKLKEAYEMGMKFDEQQDTMRTVWHSLTTEAPKDGQELIDYINKIGTSTIYDTDTINRMAQSFYHVHSNVQETKDWTNSFVALGSTLHMSNDALAESGEQFAKIVAGGKASSEDMAVMINRFPMFGEALQQATGKSMKQLYAMSAAGKLSATQFTEALSFLGKKYESGTTEAMTSYMGMSMYIKSRLQVMMGDITQSSFNMSKAAMGDIKTLLSDGAIKQYANGISEAMSMALSGAIKVLGYLADHRKTVVDIIGDLFQMGKIIGGTVFQTGYDVFKAIGEALGLVSDKGKDAKDPLQTVDDILDNLVKHKSAIQDLTRVWMAFFAIEKITGWIGTINKARDAILGFAGAQKILDATGGGGGNTTKTIANDAEQAAGDAAQNGGLFSKIKGLFSRGGEASESTGLLSRIKGLFSHGGGAASEGANIMDDVADTASTAGRYSGAIKGVAGAGAALAVVGSMGDVLGSNRKTLSGNLGGASGAGLGAWGGTAMGASLGTAIAPGIGTAIGAAIGGFAGSTVGKEAGHKLGSFLGTESAKAMDATFHPKLDDGGISKNTDKLKGGMKGFAKSYQGSMDNIKKDMVLLSGANGKDASKIEADMTKTYKNMSKSVDAYYKNKEAKSKSDLDLLVKNGQMTQKQENTALAREKKQDSDGAKRMKDSYANMQKETEKYYKQRNQIEQKSENDETKAIAKIEKERAAQRKALEARDKRQGKSKSETDDDLDKFDRKTAERVQAEKEKFTQQSNAKLEKLNRNYQNTMTSLEKKAGNATYGALKINAGKQKDLLSDLENSKQKLSQRGMQQAISTSAKETKTIINDAEDQYDKVRDAANKKYKSTVAAADREYYENHTISKKQHDEIIKNAGDERDGVIKAAKKQETDTVAHAKSQHKAVVHEATKQAGEHESAVNSETGKVKGLWDHFVDKVAGIWNGLIDAWNWVGKLWGKKATGHWKRYAVGTGGTPRDQFAVVGEEGFELAHHPSMGIFPVGLHGMETTFLPKGTSILPHHESEQFLQMTGALPHHADGVFGTISDIFDKVKKSASGIGHDIAKAFGSAEKFVTKGVSGAWDWIQSKTGLSGLNHNGGEMAKMQNEFGSGTFKTIKNEFSKTFASLFKKAKDDEEESADGAGGTYSPSMIKKAAAAMHVSVDDNFIHLLQATIQSESGGRNVIQQIHDMNSGGNEARGILQFTPPTFAYFAAPGHKNIMSPYDQLLAFFNNSDWQHSIGHTSIWGHAKVDWLHSGPQGHPRLAWGGRFDKATPAVIGEDGAEYAINVTKPNADELLAAAMEERSKKDPNGFFSKVLADFQTAQQQQSAAAVAVPSFSFNTPGMHDQSSKQSNGNPDDFGNLVGAIAGTLEVHNNIQIDGKTIAKQIVKPTSEEIAKLTARQKKGLI